MRGFLPSKIVAVLVLYTSIIAYPFIIHAQVDPGNTGTRKRENTPKLPSTKNNRPDPSKTRIPRVTLRTGALTVVAEPDAFVTLTPLERPELKKRETVAPDERAVSFEGLRPGRYHVRAELQGYRPDERDFDVKPNRVEELTLNLVPITYDVTLDLNTPTGKVMYSKGNEPSHIIAFRDKRAVLPALRPGTYKIEFEPDDASYLRRSVTIEVSAEKTNYSFALEKKLSVQEFSWASAADWSLPGVWVVDSGKLELNGKGVALPRSDSFRYYKDFELSVHVRMINGIAVSLAVHAKDPQNYYLIQLTGPNADEPYVLRGFVVRDGREQPFGRTQRIKHVADTIKPRKFFRVLMTMTNNVINVSVEDSDTGDLTRLNILTDSDNTFPIGAVGIAVRDNEKNEVEAFTVCPSQCLRPPSAGNTSGIIK